MSQGFEHNRGLAARGQDLHLCVMVVRGPLESKISGIILAGGLGLRLGGVEKALVTLAGLPLAAHVAARLAPQLTPGGLTLNANGPKVLYVGLGLPVIADDVAGRPGPLAGILAAMRVVRQKNPQRGWLLSAPADTPFLPRDLVRQLAEQAKTTGAEIVLAASISGLCPVCGLWSVSLADDVAAALAAGHNKVRSFVEARNWQQVKFAPDLIQGQSIDPFFNINTPQDLTRANEILDPSRS